MRILLPFLALLFYALLWLSVATGSAALKAHKHVNCGHRVCVLS